MTPEEIRNYIEPGDEDMELFKSNPTGYCAVFLREIAAQLAEINLRGRSESNMERSNEN